MSKLTPIIKDSFIQYSGAVLQSRALTDARDNLKPSARQILYCMYWKKHFPNKPYDKTANVVGETFKFYIHGQASAEGVIMRLAQPFTQRYPLIQVHGNYGTIQESGNWSASRYSSCKLSPIAMYLFKDIDKDAINEWFDNYDDTEKYPSVMPSKGFFNIVNGQTGIGIGLSSQIPQYNLREVNEALIKLLWNPSVDFDEIFCAPDFATGAILLNIKEVKESHKTGKGKACKLRAVISYDAKDNCFIVEEIPYGVYTNTICSQLEQIINGEDNPGIDRFNDLSKAKPNIKIYLQKKADKSKVLRYLYKNTSLQHHYSVNFTVLENGRYPKIYGWRELLLAHLAHEKEVYRNTFNYDLKKIRARAHIIEGLLKAYDAIDEVIHTIKTSPTSALANIALQKLLGIDDVQAKAILDLKLSRLSKLDITKLTDELNSLYSEEKRIKEILSNEDLFKKEIEYGLREVIEKFSDERRTQIMNVESDEQEEPVEEKSLIISLTNKNNVYVTETSSLYISRRASAGNKIKLSSDECFVNSISGNTSGESLFVTKTGKIYRILNTRLPIDSLVDLNYLFSTKLSEDFINLLSLNNAKQYNYLTIATLNGNIKKTLLSEYHNCRQGTTGIKLKEDDEIVSVFLTNNEQLMCVSDNGLAIVFDSSEIAPSGRATQGVKAMTLKPNTHLACVVPLNPSFDQVIFCTEKGKVLRTKIKEFSIQKRAGKGIIAVNLDEGDRLIDATLINERASDIILAGDSRIIRFPASSISLQARAGKGVIGIKSKETIKTNKILVE